MTLRAWYFVTLILTALLMGTSFGHTLEMPAKMKVDGTLWMTFQHTLYPYFAYIGAPVELGAIIVAGILSFLLRRQSGFYPALIGTACLAIAFLIVWLGFTNPVNAETAKWTAESIPADWAEWRSQWEYSHMTRFALHLAGFSALLFSFSAVCSKEASS
ncbi:MAG TPA: DUF1772 domain-containing protein [Candidatus Binatia bacterium]|nr:DUF1772 domain-containing protein [Candidatus Binatia bacterium]